MIQFTPHSMPKETGWIEVIAGCMFSGKTEELIRRLRRAQIAKQNVKIFKPKIDLRYSNTSIVSHSEQSLPSLLVTDAREILTLSNDAQVVGIDEAQFFDEGIVLIAQRLADDGLRVIVAGLDTDFRGEPFGPMPELMAKAEVVDKLHAICMVCGEPASRTQRLVNSQPACYEDPVVIVGASEMYEARCREHHQVPHRS